MTLTRSPAEIAEALALVAPPAPFDPRYNLAPTQDALTVRLDPEAGRVAEWRRWGLVPSWAKDRSIGNRLFNARAETVATKPSFRSAYKRRRCVVVCDGFYEWMKRGKTRQPYHFRPVSSELLCLAGLYEEWIGEGGEVVDSCTVITTEAGPDVETVHHRMPVLVGLDQLDRWTDPRTPVDELAPLLVPAPAGTLERVAVSTYVNSSRNEGAACLDPMGE